MPLYLSQKVTHTTPGTQLYRLADHTVGETVCNKITSIFCKLQIGDRAKAMIKERESRMG